MSGDPELGGWRPSGKKGRRKIKAYGAARPSRRARGPFRCRDCKAKFTTQQGLHNHSEKGCPECPECGRKFKDGNAVRQHYEARHV